MQNLVITICCSVLLLGACGSDTSSENQPNQPAEVNEVSIETCSCDELNIDSTGMHTKSGQAFTGICTKNYENSDVIYLEKNLLQGKLHGKVIYYDKSGEVLLEETYENGVARLTGNAETTLTCNCSDLDVKNVQGIGVYKLNNVPFTGRCEKFYENSSQLYMESYYKSGFLHGYTVYYNRDGSTILMEKYENGLLVNTLN
ncbi:MAG: hypothetical protein IPM74_01835 [Crocinitomicaceae bacterium]|nr:hypothetical protein [Crocinitomicaceae bacterium]